MKKTRRQLLYDGARLMAALAAGKAGLLRGQQPTRSSMPSMAKPSAAKESPTRPWLHPEKLAQFVDPLPTPSALRAKEQRANPLDPSQQIGYLRVEMRVADV